jgi:hypothetical protein
MNLRELSSGPARPGVAVHAASVGGIGMTEPFEMFDAKKGDRELVG